jgi:hypothetical protein
MGAYGNPSPSTLSNGSPCIPHNVRFLLSHYINHVVSSLTGLPQDEAPWKKIHLPYAMAAYGELDVLGHSSFARVSLLYSLLSLTCFHLATLYKPTSIDGSIDVQGLTNDQQTSNLQYWNSQGSQFREMARTAFRKCRLQISSELPEYLKYKELFVSAMSLICTGVSSSALQSPVPHPTADKLQRSSAGTHGTRDSSYSSARTL